MFANFLIGLREGLVAGETYAGLEAIQAKVEANASAGWVCEQTSDPIQQVINQTAYPAP